MNTQQAAELWPIIKAFSEGKAVQARIHATDPWDNPTHPNFDPTLQWRIKPEPRVIWVNQYEYNHPSVHDSEQKAIDEKRGVPGVKTIKFIEAT
jgi:hypothetical protein